MLMVYGKLFPPQVSPSRPKREFPTLIDDRQQGLRQQGRRVAILRQTTFHRIHRMLANIKVLTTAIKSSPPPH